jgi:molybdenum cofactor cytidylyltransferase
LKRNIIVGVYLAAGSSRRMGSAKLDLEPEPGKKLGHYALQEGLRSGLDGMVVVVREMDPLAWIPKQCIPQGRTGRMFKTVVCGNASEGMSRSLQCGVRCAEELLRADAVIVLLADQPCIDRVWIDRLIAEFRNNPQWDYVALSDEGVPKPPMLLTNRMFPAIHTLQGDAGARMLLQSGKYKGTLIACPDKSCFLDVDTTDDWIRIRMHLNRGKQEM